MSSPRHRPAGNGASPGRTLVSFVGVGPGDDGLLTLRAVERLAAADVVVVDQIERGALLASYCRPDVEVLDAGFGEDGQLMTRAARAKLVVRAGRNGGLVVRLMDGDPSTFIGLPEEIAACRKADLPVEVVPGVSSVHAIPAYAGVMLIPSGEGGVHVVHPNGAAVDWSRHVAPGNGGGRARSARGHRGGRRGAARRRPGRRHPGDRHRRGHNRAPAHRHRPPRPARRGRSDLGRGPAGRRRRWRRAAPARPG